MNASSLQKEVWLLTELSLQTMAIQLCTVMPPFLVASMIGRAYGSVYLDGFSVGNLTGNLFLLSILQGIFSASDTLSPQAFGANNERELGLIAMRGVTFSFCIMIPINAILYFWMDAIMDWLGVDSTVSEHAWRWYQVYQWTMPFYIIFQAAWKFLSAQQVMLPCVISVVLSSTVVAPVALCVWSKICGYLGTAMAIVSYQVAATVFLLGYIWIWKPHTEASWPGFKAWRESFEWEKMTLFLVSVQHRFGTLIVQKEKTMLT